jgi:hypothetical protein
MRPLTLTKVPSRCWSQATWRRPKKADLIVEDDLGLPRDGLFKGNQEFFLPPYDWPIPGSNGSTGELSPSLPPIEET